MQFPCVFPSQKEIQSVNLTIKISIKFWKTLVRRILYLWIMDNSFLTIISLAVIYSVHLASLLNKFFVEKSWVSRTPIPASQSLLVKPFPKYLKFLLHLKIHKILGLFLKNAYPCLCLLFTMFEMKQLLMLDIFLVSSRVWQPQYFKINMKKKCVD